MAEIVFIEAFYGGSHKQLIDLLCTLPNHVLYTLPDKKWHWRSRTSALYFSQVIPASLKYRVLFTSSVLNLAELVALRPDLASLRKVLYFHENQLVYPIRKQQERDFQFGYNQILSCLVADEVIFNSTYNKESFLSNIQTFIKLIPDHRPKGLADIIRPKCRVIHFPLCLPHQLGSSSSSSADLYHVLVKTTNCATQCTVTSSSGAAVDVNIDLTKSTKAGKQYTLSTYSGGPHDVSSGLLTYSDPMMARNVTTQSAMPASTGTGINVDGGLLTASTGTCINVDDELLTASTGTGINVDGGMLTASTGSDINVDGGLLTASGSHVNVDNNLKARHPSTQCVLSTLYDATVDVDDCLMVNCATKQNKLTHSESSDLVEKIKQIDRGICSITQSSDPESKLKENVSEEMYSSDDSQLGNVFYKNCQYGEVHGESDKSSIGNPDINTLKHCYDVQELQGRTTTDTANCVRSEYNISVDHTKCISCTQKDAVLHIVWAHRWEHDKDPDTLFKVLFRLHDEGYHFNISVLGECFTQVPDVFYEAQQRLSSHILNWGYLKNKQDYYMALSNADVSVSTALHEFFGVAMLESVLLRCYPLCPHRLVYPEIFPDECLYRTTNQLYKRLRVFCEKPHLSRKTTPMVNVDKFCWKHLKREYEELLRTDN